MPQLTDLEPILLELVDLYDDVSLSTDSTILFEKLLRACVGTSEGFREFIESFNTNSGKSYKGLFLSCILSTFSSAYKLSREDKGHLVVH